MKIKGRLEVRIREVSTGEVRLHDAVDNLVVDTGITLLIDRLDGTSTAYLTHMAVGTGTTVPVAGNTALQAETVRNVLDSSTQAGNGKSTVFQMTLTSTQGNGTSISEAGILTASSGGVLFNRATFTAYAKTSSQEIIFQWTVVSADA